jgi:hypothetical protein
MENPSFNPFQPSVGDCDGDTLVGTALDSVCVGLIALNDSPRKRRQRQRRARRLR